ncbi:MAG TPA: hypothetical protein VGP25_13795 [Gemmatimonadaceae bacterium]|nr:hypothetical protein [Gemmatimonadaceae bacterium]
MAIDDCSRVASAELLPDETAQSAVVFLAHAVAWLATLGHRGELSHMAEHSNIKPDARQLVERLPESATWDDLAYEVYVRQAIEQGIAQADQGQTIAHEDALARVRSRIRRAS